MLNEFKKVFQSKSATRLLAASLTSNIGDWFYVTVIYALVAKVGGYSALAFIATFRYACAIVLMPIGGVLVDRLPRKTVMVVADLVRFIVMVAMAGVCASSSPSILAITVLSCATAVASVFFTPARSGLLPMTVDRDSRTALNAIDGSIGTAILTAAPAVAGALLTQFDYWVIVALNAASFLVSATFVWSVRVPTNTSQIAAQRERSRLSYRHDLAEGLQVMATSPRVPAYTVLAAAVHVGVGATWIFVPAFAFGTGLGASGVGYLSSAIGLGSVLGALAGGAAASKYAWPLAVGSVLAFVIGMGAWGATQHSAVLSMAGAFLLGFFACAFDPPCMAHLQETVPEKTYSRVFSVFDALALLGLLCGSNVAAFGLKHLGLVGGLIGVAVAMGVVWALALFLFIRQRSSMGTPAAAEIH